MGLEVTGLEEEGLEASGLEVTGLEEDGLEAGGLGVINAEGTGLEAPGLEALGLEAPGIFRLCNSKGCPLLGLALAIGCLAIGVADDLVSAEDEPLRNILG